MFPQTALTSPLKTAAGHNESVTAASAARRRKQPVETAPRRSLARQTPALGGLAKKSTARTPSRTVRLVSRDGSGQLPAGLPHGAGWAGVAVSTELGRGSLGVAVTDSRLTHARPRVGYLRIWVLLRREGWRVNRKRVRRLSRLEGVQLPMRVRRRKHVALHRGPALTPARPTERWSTDFVQDTLADGRPFRILTVVDQ